jgi:lipopolysaccharide export system permease protein
VLGGILSRMILWELMKVFAMALAAITGILLLAGIIAEATQQGLGPGQILAAIPLLVPSTLPYTLPATTLFACCVVYGRLAADNEILAVKAAGASVLPVAAPGLLLGAIASVVTMGLYYEAIPRSHAMLRQLVFNDAEELLYSMLKKHNTLNQAQFPYALWVRGVQGRKLIDPVIKTRNLKTGEWTSVIRAKEGELLVDMAHRRLIVHLKCGTVSTPNGASNGSYEQDNGTFDEDKWTIDLPPTFGPDARRRERDLTWRELLARRRVLEKELEESRNASEQAPAVGDSAVAPESGLHRSQMGLQQQYIQQQIAFIDVELQMRPALSVGCLCFILIGCPVGVWFNRSDFLSSFITCFLPIVVVYYPLMLCGAGMAKSGGNDIAALVWAADAVVGTAGVVLFWRLLRR